MGRFAEFVIEHRKTVFVTIVLVTLFFGWYALRIGMQMDFRDLQPVDHPFIRVNTHYQSQYGSPLTIFMMLRVKHGNIYNAKTLEKIRRLTAALDALPGVNHDRVVSIASRKVKVLKIKGNYFETNNLMPRDVPHTKEGLAHFRENVAAAGVMGSLVSPDGTASLLTANFIQGRFELRDLFERLRKIKAAEEDANSEIFLAGQPVLMGWVGTYLREIFVILALTFVLTCVLLFAYLRHWALTGLPIVATLMSALWGLGFAGLFGWALDPLILIIPVLLIARTLSHGVQRMERIIEMEDEALDPTEKGRVLIRALFGSGVLGIITDTLGILILALTSIPLLRRLAFFGSFWALSIVVTVLIFMSTVIAIFGGAAQSKVKASLESSAITRFLEWLSGLVLGRGATWVLVSFAAISVAALVVSSRIVIGDAHPGTALLWPDSTYNVAVKNISQVFSGTDDLQVFVETHSVPGVRDPAVLEAMRDFQRHLERSAYVQSTFSYADFIPLVRRRLNGNHVKWAAIPDSLQASEQYANLLLKGTDPGDFGRFVSEDYQNASIIVSLRDHRGDTLRSVVSDIQHYIAAPAHGSDHKLQYRLAGGLGGVLAAVNEEVAAKQVLVFVIAAVIIALACLYAFRSWIAVLILVTPLVATNFIVMSLMVFMGVGLDVNTLPVVSVGMGVGIDYGIYLLTRILQEHQHVADYGVACRTALLTTGRAIFFTASIMVVSAVLWYFLSSFRFLAEMGLLLSLIMGINMVGALLVIPAAVQVFQPRFPETARILAWE
ncbi:MAG: RND family transporter [Candidatus Binatia bacterium]